MCFGFMWAVSVLQALETHLIERARYDIFGSFAPTHIGRTGRKELRRNLIGSALTSYYPLRNRPHRVRRYFCCLSVSLEGARASLAL
jgi:hypothetical protein